MPLQNRVDPNGNIISTSARGSWMGNRGQLHGATKSILRPFKLKAWLTCVLVFKDRLRPVMAPNQYTELFFLDEATAFAAGHRACFECRRKDYDRFKSAWLKGNPEYGFTEKTSIQLIDDILHKERMNPTGGKVTYQDNSKDLPDGTFIQIDKDSFLITEGKPYRWTPFGYDDQTFVTAPAVVTVLTPKSTVNALAAGYRPQMAIGNHS